MISVSGLTKNYGDLVAVNNISFDIRKGEITGLLGPNGAGKTTTLRMLTCFLKPTAGTVTVGDYLVHENPILVKKTIGYLPESAPIYPDMIVYDYLKFTAEVRGVPEDLVETRIREAAEVCGIREIMHRNVGECSKGYKQRVGLAYTMLNDPEILILDEPTSGLDPNQIVDIRNVIKAIGKKKTVILSTHILSEAEATCDRIIIINKGTIVADSTTENLKSSFGNMVSLFLKIGGVNGKALSEEIKKISGVKNISQINERKDHTAISISSAAGTDIRPAIMKLMTDKGWTLLEMKQEQESLENIFRALTRGGDDES